MKMKLLALPLLFFACSALYAQDRFDVLPYWKYYQARTPHVYHLLMDQAMEQLGKRNEKVARIKTTADWQTYRNDLRKKVEQSVGTFPQKTPLNARVTSTVESNGVVVENILYESLPGYHVSASFFKRKDLNGQKLPVILFCSGHSANGYRSAGYQHIILNYVKKGFAVLAFDPIGQGERIQYRKADGKAAMGTTHDHSYSGSRAFLLGYSPAKYFIWDGIRSIDYLETRPDVDIRRLGIAGRSGGGTQSSYIAALDDRVVAAAPECYITTYEMLLKSKGPQDAEQVFYEGIANGIDIPDLLHLRAPKPTLVVTTTNDIFSIQGVRDIEAELSKLYRMAGKQDDFLVVEDNAGHAPTKLNREACYRFFSKHLDNPCDTNDETVAVFDDEQLFASPGGDVFTIPGSKRLDEIIAASAEPATRTKKIETEALARLLNYRRDTRKNTSIFSGTILTDGYSADKYLVKAPSGYHIPVVVFHRGSSEHPRKNTVLYLHEKGKTADSTLIIKLLSRHHQVVCADLSGIGELQEYYNWQGDAFIDKTPLNLWYLALLTGQTLSQYRLGEIDALYDFILSKTPDTPLSGLAVGGVTTDLLHWAALNTDRLEFLTLIKPILSYRTVLKARDYKTSHLLHTGGGMLLHYDLPDLYRQTPAEKLRLINPVSPNGDLLGESSPEIPGGIARKSLLFVTNVIDGI